MGDKVEQTAGHLLLDDEVGLLDDDLLALVVEGHEDGGHPQHPLFHLAVENGKALCLSLLFKQRAVGDIARLRGHVERTVELIEAAVDLFQLVFAAFYHSGAPEGGQIADQRQKDGESGCVLQQFFQSKHESIRCEYWQ